MVVIKLNKWIKFVDSEKIVHYVKILEGSTLGIAYTCRFVHSVEKSSRIVRITAGAVDRIFTHKGGVYMDAHTNNSMDVLYGV